MILNALRLGQQIPQRTGQGQWQACPLGGRPPSYSRGGRPSQKKKDRGITFVNGLLGQ